MSQCCDVPNKPAVECYFIGDAEDSQDLAVSQILECDVIDYEMIEDEEWEVISEERDEPTAATPRVCKSVCSEPDRLRGRKAGSLRSWASLMSHDEAEQGTTTTQMFPSLPPFCVGNADSETSATVTSPRKQSAFAISEQEVVSHTARRAGKGKGNGSVGVNRQSLATTVRSAPPVQAVSAGAPRALLQSDESAVEAAPSCEAPRQVSTARPPGNSPDSQASTVAALNDRLDAPEDCSSSIGIQREMALFLGRQSGEDVAFLGAVLGVGSDADSVAGAIMSVSAGAVPSGSLLAAATALSACDLEQLKGMYFK